MGSLAGRGTLGHLAPPAGCSGSGSSAAVPGAEGDGAGLPASNAAAPFCTAAAPRELPQIAAVRSVRHAMRAAGTQHAPRRPAAALHMVTRAGSPAQPRPGAGLVGGLPCLHGLRGESGGVTRTAAHAPGVPGGKQEADPPCQFSAAVCVANGQQQLRRPHDARAGSRQARHQCSQNLRAVACPTYRQRGPYPTPP